MALNDVKVTKLNGGLGRREPSTDGVSGMIIMGVETGLTIGFAEPVVLNSLADAVALGFSYDLDTTNEILMYEHIKEFFRINPNGTLWIMVLSRTLGYQYSQLVDPANDGTALRLINAAEGKINQLAVVLNPTDKTFLLDKLKTAVLMAQTLVDSEYVLHRPIHIVLDGYGCEANSNSDDSNIFDLRDQNCPGVSVMLGQGSRQMIGAVEDLMKSTSIGTILGAISLAKVNEDIAWVQKFNVMGSGLEQARLGLSEMSFYTNGVINSLNTKGFIFFRNHTGIAGIYFNDSHTGAELTSDYAYIENNRTINKATRIIRSTLLPYLNGPVPVNPTTGKLAAEYVKNLEALGNRAIDELMFKNAELSGFSFTIDENQNILSTSLLDTNLSLIPTGTARNINVNIGFTNPFNS